MSGTCPSQRGDEAQPFTVHAARLRSIVGRHVRTSQANVDDACAFAWLQMLRYQPERERLLTWLSRTAIRAAIKLDRRAQRSCELVEAADADVRHADTRGLADDQVELPAAREAVAAARLRTRERVTDLMRDHIDEIHSDRTSHQWRLAKLLPSLIEEFGDTREPEVIRGCTDRILDDYDNVPIRSHILTLANRRSRECLKQEQCAILES